jgi:hypothetical protein
MEVLLNTKIRLHRADFADNFILDAGEPGWHTSTKEFKIGDGVTPWKTLKLANEDQLFTIFKQIQKPVADPTANGAALAFIDSISQDAQGKITVTKKSVDLSAYALKTDLPSDEDFGVLTIDKKDGTAIEVDNSDSQNPKVGLLLKNNGNVVLSQTNDGLSANIDLSSYELTDTTYTFATGTEDGTFTVTEEGNPDKVTVKVGGKTVTETKKELIGEGQVAAANDTTPNTIIGAKQYADARKEEVLAALDAVATAGLTRQIVETLPSVDTAAMNTIYMIKRAVGEHEKDVYDEYLLIDVQGTKSFELLGNTELDLADYYNKSTADNTFKLKQTAVSDPTANGTGVTFIDSISQDTEGVITVSKKTIDAYTKQVADDTFKKIQKAVTAKATATNEFVDTIAQTANGEVSITTKNVDFTEINKKVQDHIDSDHVTKVTAVKSGTYKRSDAAAEADILDIVVTPAQGTGELTVKHAEYNSGIFKDIAHDTKANPSFITGIEVQNGHVIGATVQNLAEVLAGMTFVLDGGTSGANS